MTDERRKRPGPVFWATTILVLALVSYAALYLYMVDAFHSSLKTGMGPWRVDPNYRWNGEMCRDQRFWRKVFAPVHWVDTKVRPDEWWIGIRR